MNRWCELPLVLLLVTVKVGYSLFEMFKRWDKEMIKRKYWVHCTNTSRHVRLLHWLINSNNVPRSLNYALSLRMDRFVSGTEQLCPRYRHKSVSGSRVGHKSLSFPPTGQKSARHLGDFQPAYITRQAFDIIHLSIYIFIFRHAYWRKVKVICTYASFNANRILIMLTLSSDYCWTRKYIDIACWIVSDIYGLLAIIPQSDLIYIFSS